MTAGNRGSACGIPDSGPGIHLTAAALAFVLSMIADFTALPAALWILFRARPDVRSETPQS